jgi:uncharacterized protein (TIGR03437 family)
MANLRTIVCGFAFLSAGALWGSDAPTEWKAINYAPRGHPYFRMLLDWYDRDASTGLEVRQMADDDLAMLSRSGFNAVHLYLWDHATFEEFQRKGTTKSVEPAGFAFPEPERSTARQWEAMEEFVAMAEKHRIWVIPHPVHTPFNEGLDSMSRTEVESRANTIAAWEGKFVSQLLGHHKNILAWGLLYALEPAPDDRPERPNNYSLLWRKLYAAMKRKLEAESPAGHAPPLIAFLYFPSRGRNISAADAEVPLGVLDGYSLDARVAKQRFASMKRHLSYELGYAAEPDLVYTYLFGPDTGALEDSLRELTTGTDAVPAARVFVAEFGISSPFGSYGNATLAFGENGTPTTDPDGQALWLRQCLCGMRAVGIGKTAYWTLYDAASLWSSRPWSMSPSQVSLNGHWGLAFEEAVRGFKPAWQVIGGFYRGQRFDCEEPRLPVVESRNGPVRLALRGSPPHLPVKHSGVHILSTVSSANFRTGAWYPGSLLTLYVAGLRIPGNWQAAGFPLPTNQFGIQVEFQSRTGESHAGALLAIANIAGMQQINVQVPWELPEVLSLKLSQGAADAVRDNFETYWGDFFVDAFGNALAFHENTGLPVTAVNPAHSSEAVLLYLTNVPFRPKVVPATAEPIDANRPASDYAVNLAQYRIIADGTGFAAGAAISYIRLAPDSVGTFQMRLVVPQVKAAQTIQLYYSNFVCQHSGGPGICIYGYTEIDSRTTLPVVPAN